MNLLTVFTPTYNRAYLLPNLYESLLSQSNKGFEWLIVDDGSIDWTNELINKWIANGQLSIRYYKQKNQGKHIAHNKGVAFCNTPLFFCVDSDDKLTKNAVQLIYDLYEEELDNKVLGFYMRKGDLNGNPVGENWPHHVKYATLNELYQKYHYCGEAAIILYTVMIKPFTYPQFDDEKFIRETVFYDQINDIASMRLEDHVCYLYEYQDDGYTAQGLRLELNNPIGTGYNFLHHIRYLSGLTEKCKFMGQYLAWKELFCINEPLYKKVRMPICVRIGGYLLKAHYLNLFMRHREALIK